jgi:hypothetical protein
MQRSVSNGPAVRDGLQYLQESIVQRSACLTSFFEGVAKMDAQSILRPASRFTPGDGAFGGPLSR